MGVKKQIKDFPQALSVTDDSLYGVELYNPLNGKYTFRSVKHSTLMSQLTANVPEAVYSTVIFVDTIYGNDATGLAGNSSKPFLTIAAAVSATVTLSPNSSNRVLIHLRTGYYAENINLTNYVDFYADPSVMIDGGVSDSVAAMAVNSNFLGYAKFKCSGFTKAYSITYASTSVFQFDTINTLYESILISPTSGTANITIIGNSIEAKQPASNSINIQKTSNVILQINRQIRSCHDPILIDSTYSGKLTINCPQTILTTGTSYATLKNIIHITSTTSTAIININSELINETTGSLGATIGMLSIDGSVGATINITKNITGSDSQCIYENSSNANCKITLMNNKIYSKTGNVFSFNNLSSIYFKSCSIVATGGACGFVYNTGKTFFHECVINVLVGAATNITLNATSLVYFYNCLINGGTTFLDSAVAVTAQIHNTRSNVALHVNVTDALAPTGLIVDAGLLIPNF